MCSLAGRFSSRQVFGKEEMHRVNSSFVELDSSEARCCDKWAALAA
jgi:hypothetical protein